MLSSIRQKLGIFAVMAPDARPRRPRRVRPALDALEGRQLLSFLGSETQVSPPASGSQLHSANASSANGTSVVVWVDNNFLTDRNILAQRYDASGAKVGPVIQVDISNADSTDPAVAMDAKGNFVVTWSDSLLTGQGDIRARYFNASGSPEGAAFTVANNAKTEYEPDVAASNGSFVITYVLHYSSTDLDVRAHRYTVANGVIADAGDFNISSGVGVEEHPSVAMAPDGAFDIVYESYPQSARTTTGFDGSVMFRRSPPSGVLPAGAQVGTTGPSPGLYPDVAMDNAGNAVVAYQKLIGNDYDIKATRVSSTGTVGTETIVRATTRDEAAPSVALAPTGGQFVVAYYAGGQVEAAEMAADDTRLAV